MSLVSQWWSGAALTPPCSLDHQRHRALSPELVTADATDFDNGTLGSTQKARGIGDCWGSEQWTWNGTGFVQTSASSTGMCKGFAGGAWELPTLVTEIR